LFAQHIEQRAIDWIGNYQETQFSVNMLVIDNRTVLAVNQNPLLTEFLASKGIEVILADFRCKSFWDGGMHCLTCDITRTGGMKDYFNDRPGINYLDWIT
jgi:N-dimethylarginine dimethylaminohydrolase